MSGVNEIWPGWQIIEELGKGQFGHVYKIKKTDDHTGREFFSALKVITIPKSDDEAQYYLDDGYDLDSITNLYANQVNRIVDEFSLLYRFKGTANIVSYEDHRVLHSEDSLSWQIMIRMELLTPMTKYLAAHPMSESDVIRCGIDICRALELCQTENIIHRDIKPQNIFVNDFGSFKLGDFGIARSMDHTTHATLAGTMTYLAPEVFRREKYNSSVDMYSLGLVMYWLLNERRMPFLPLPPALPTASQSEEALARRYHGDALPPPAHASEELAAIILKACAFRPEDRFATPAQMRRTCPVEIR